MAKRGAYVWLVGPDGSGKSTIATALAEAGAEVVYWRAGVFPMARQLAGKPISSEINSEPHKRRPDGRMKASARLIYYAIDNALGYYLRVRPTLAAGTHFVVDRGWADMCIDPRRYGFQSSRLSRFLYYVLPKPRAILLVTVEPELAYARKPELEIHEIERQYEAWRSWAVIQTRLREVSNAESPEIVGATAVALVQDLA